jgi:hypothetical protein
MRFLLKHRKIIHLILWGGYAEYGPWMDCEDGSESRPAILTIWPWHPCFILAKRMAKRKTDQLTKSSSDRT